MQYYTALPNAIIGFWILLDARVFKLRHTKISFAICLCLLTAAMIALAVAASFFAKKFKTDVPAIAFGGPIASFVYVSFPFSNDVCLYGQAMFLICVSRPSAIYFARALNGSYLPFTAATWFTVLTYILTIICIILAGYCWYTTGDRIKKHRAQKKLERRSNNITEQREEESQEDKEKQGVVTVQAVEV